MIPKLISHLTKRLAQPLPGKKAQNIMMVTPPYSYAISGKYTQRIPAGVLILLFPRNNGWHFFLTKRTYKVDHHKGQISLPGGVMEDGETLTQAALRETHEEIGVLPKLITVIGSLTSFNIPVSGFEIFPFIKIVYVFMWVSVCVCVSVCCVCVCVCGGLCCVCVSLTVTDICIYWSM